MFIDALDIDDVIAHLLVTEGFGSLEEVAFVPVDDLAEIEGFDVEVAAELQERARNALERRDREYESRSRELGVADDLAALEGLTPGMLVTLAENGIKTLDDFAGLAGDELIEMLAASDKGGVKLELDDANALIMAARAHWFEQTGADAGAAPQGVSATAAAERRAPEAGEVPMTAPAPQRRCIVTGEVRDRDTLVRVVVAPDGAIVPDIEARLPGRGLWLTPRRDIVEQAVAKRIFARAARRPVAAPPELADRIESLLARRCCDALGLARRAGLAVAGFERVGEAARRGRAGLLLFALDGAEGGYRKLAAFGRDLPLARVLTAAELGGAFGRERIVHAVSPPVRCAGGC